MHHKDTYLRLKIDSSTACMPRRRYQSSCVCVSPGEHPQGIPKETTSIPCMSNCFLLSLVSAPRKLVWKQDRFLRWSNEIVLNVLQICRTGDVAVTQQNWKEASSSYWLISSFFTMTKEVRSWSIFSLHHFNIKLVSLKPNYSFGEWFHTFYQ